MSIKTMYGWDQKKNPAVMSDETTSDRTSKTTNSSDSNAIILDGNNKVNIKYSSDISYESAADMNSRINKLSDRLHDLEQGEEFKAIMNLFNKDATEALAAYKKFLKDSGYDSIRAERDRLQQKAEERRKAEAEYYANEAVRKEK